MQHNDTAWRCAVAVAFLWATDATFALDPTKAITQYARRAWESSDGLPQNSVQAIAQTPDGYIWIGTQEGVARFDGVVFTTFNQSNTPELKSNYVYALVVDRAGTLWMGMNGGGVTRYKEGKFTTTSVGEGLTSDTVISIAQDAHGDMWLGTGQGVTVFHDGVFSAFTGDEALRKERVMAVVADTDGSLWFGSYTNGVGHWKDNNFTRLTEAEGLSNKTVWALYQDREAALWIGTVGGGLFRRAANEIRAFHAADGLKSDSIFGMREDRDNNLWIATDGGGIVRYTNGVFTALGHAEGLTNDTTWPVFEDRSGIIWIGTLKGLNQLRDAAFTPVGMPEGLPEEVILTVAEDASGALWLGGNNAGVTRWKNGRATVFTKKTGLAMDSVRSVYPDREGNMWLGTIGGLTKYDGSKLTTYLQRDGLTSEKIGAMYEDPAGAMWIGTFGGGLNRLDNGKFTHFTTKDGLPNDRVLAIIPRRAGGLWIGTDGGGISAYDRGLFTNYNARSGLADDHVEALHEDADGVLWVGTGGGGISRVRDGKVATITTRQGLADDLTHQILEDDQGYLWLSSNRGISRVSREELNNVADGRADSVHAVVFGTDDGMRSNECNGASQPSGWRGKDGRLWFATMDGAVAVTPSAVLTARAPPDAIVEKALVNGEPIQPSARIRSGAGSLEFHYTALDFQQPSALRFRYRLEGFDKTWIDAGTRRDAYYTNIPPGSYTFFVSAATNGGSWNKRPTAVAFEVPARFFQTPWFRVLCVIAIAGAIGAAHNWRARHLTRKTDELRALMTEREKAEAEVRKLNAELEHRVADRTAELEAMNKNLESFSYSVSHDLRAPLRAINGYLQVLVEESGDKLNEDGKHAVQTARSEATRMAHLIDELLEFSRLGRQKIEPVPTEMRPIVQAALNEVRAAEPDREIEARVGALPTVNCEPVLLRQVWANLLSNAVKYTRNCKNALIEIGANRVNGDQVFFVRDNGAGFDMKYADKLFGVFQRLHGNSEFEGNGVGLAFVKQIIQQHRGRVWAEAAVNQGATFYFTLPDDSPKET